MENLDQLPDTANTREDVILIFNEEMQNLMQIIALKVHCGFI